MIVDAKDAILGRLSSYVAKQVLLGNKVDVINCEECVISGKKADIMATYIKKMHRKAPTKGPFFYRNPDRLVKRVIRGMLPFKNARGREAFKSVKCHIGMPEDLKNEKAITLENANYDKIRSTDYLRLRQLCNTIGGRQ